MGKPNRIFDAKGDLVPVQVEIENKKMYIDNKIIELPFTPFKFVKFDEGVVVMMNEMGDKCRDIVVPF